MCHQLASLCPNSTRSHGDPSGDVASPALTPGVGIRGAGGACGPTTARPGQWTMLWSGRVLGSGNGGGGQSLRTTWEGPLTCICRAPAGSRGAAVRIWREFNEGLYKAQGPGQNPELSPCCSALGDKQPAGSLLRAKCWVCTLISEAFTCPH